LVILGGVFAVLQPSLLYGLAFDLLPFQQDGLAASEVDIGGGEIAQALVIALVIVVGDKGFDLGLEKDLRGSRVEMASNSCRVVLQ
jgi:hypothetical protein